MQGPQQTYYKRRYSRISWKAIRVVPVRMRDNRTIMRLLSSLIATSHRREGSYDPAIYIQRRRRTAPRGAAVYPVAAEPDDATRPYSSTAVGTSCRSDPHFA